MLHPVVLPSAALLKIYDKQSRLKINVLQSCADILIVIRVALRFMSRQSKKLKTTLPNLAKKVLVF